MKVTNITIEVHSGTCIELNLDDEIRIASLIEYLKKLPIQSDGNFAMVSMDADILNEILAFLTKCTALELTTTIL